MRYGDLRRLRATKNRSRACALCAVFFRHILPAAIKKPLRGFFIAAGKTSHTTGTLYAMLPKIY
jgi:hypothetical protein